MDQPSVTTEACSNQPPSTIRRWEVETVLLEHSRVLRSAGADRHFSLSEEQIKGLSIKQLVLAEHVESVAKQS